MAGTDLIENVILFTRLCERPSDELRPAGFRRDCLVQDCTFARALLRRLFGEMRRVMRRVTIIVPGGNVEELSVKELPV